MQESLLERIARELNDEVTAQRERLKLLEDVQEALARVLGDDEQLAAGLTEVCAPRAPKAPGRKVTEEYARDTLVRLKEVTVSEFAYALSLSKSRARAYLKRFERRKMVEVLVRESDRAHVYCYIDPRTVPPGTPPPSGEVNGVHARTHAHARANPVPGTGQQRRFRKDVQEVIEEAKSLGGMPDLSGAHPSVRMPNGNTVGLPATPSDHRSLDNVRAELKRNSG